MGKQRLAKGRQLDSKGLAKGKQKVSKELAKGSWEHPKLLYIHMPTDVFSLISFFSYSFWVCLPAGLLDVEHRLAIATRHGKVVLMKNGAVTATIPLDVRRCNTLHLVLLLAVASASPKAGPGPLVSMHFLLTVARVVSMTSIARACGPLCTSTRNGPEEGRAR